MTGTTCTQTSTRGRGKQCKVLGCTTLLGEDCSACLRKKRLCPDHLKAEAVRCKDDPETLYRFCQQCGKLEELSKFQGTKRSCKSSLAKRKVKSYARTAGSGKAGASYSNSGCTANSFEMPDQPVMCNLAAAAVQAESPCAASCGFGACQLPAAATAAGNDATPSSAARVGPHCTLNDLSGGLMHEAAQDAWTDADEEELSQMIEQELAAAAAAAAAAPAGQHVVGQAPVLAEPLILMPGMANLGGLAQVGSDYNNAGWYTPAAAAAAPAFPAPAATAAAREQYNSVVAKLHALSAQYAAIQSELDLLQEIHDSLQQPAVGTTNSQLSGSSTVMPFTSGFFA